MQHDLGNMFQDKTALNLVLKKQIKAHPPEPVKDCNAVIYTLSMSGLSSLSTLIFTKYSFIN